MKRVYRKISHSPEEEARLRAIREEFQIQRPSLDELVASGDYTEPVPHREVLDAMHIAGLLKRAREEAQISLAEASRRCGIDRAAISRIENGVYKNLTMNTLSRLASAYGKRFMIQLEDQTRFSGDVRQP